MKTNRLQLHALIIALLNLTTTRNQEDQTRIHKIILAKEQTKKILLSSNGKASRLRMRTASLKTFSLVKTIIRYWGCLGNA